MTNWERWASTPEKAADLLMQFDSNTRCNRPAVKSFERYKSRPEIRACLRTNPRSLLTEWLQEECDEQGDLR